MITTFVTRYAIHIYICVCFIVFNERKNLSELFNHKKKKWLQPRNICILSVRLRYKSFVFAFLLKLKSEMRKQILRPNKIPFYVYSSHSSIVWLAQYFKAQTQNVTCFITYGILVIAIKYML